MSDVAVHHIGAAAGAYAFIIVTYPEGSAVTCTNSSGKKNLSAAKTLFYVKKGAASCTITAMKDAKTATKTVTGITEGDSVSVELTYEAVLFENGQLSSLLGSLRNISLGTYEIEGNAIKCVKSGTNTGSATGYGTFTLPVELTGRSALCIETEADVYGTSQCFGVAAHGTTAFVASANKTKNGPEVLTIPVGQLSGEYDIVFAVWAYGDYSTGALSTAVKISRISLI